MPRFLRDSTLLAALVALVAACSGSAEARRVTLPVTTDGAGLELVTNDLGYAVEVTSATVVADDLKFTIAGEAHASLLRRFSDAVIPVAHAHPGHYQGGEVTGELPGHFVLQFAPGETTTVGDATLLVGQYHGVDMTLTRATEDDVEADDPRLGHTALLIGTASKDGADIHFRIAVDSPDARELVGIPFDEKVDESERPLVLRLMTRDPSELDTLFDGLDFAPLDADADGEVDIDPGATDTDTVAAYNQFRRTLQTHDHFVVVQAPP